jgi:hypothetical protein
LNRPVWGAADHERQEPFFCVDKNLVEKIGHARGRKAVSNLLIKTESLATD